MDEALFLATMNLYFQLIILALITAGYFLKRMKKLYLHGLFMWVSFSFNTASIIIIMIPSFIGRAYFLNTLSILIFMHAILGSLTEVLIGRLVLSWKPKPSFQTCIKKKVIMRWTIILWVTVILFGIILYLGLYTDIFP